MSAIVTEPSVCIPRTLNNVTRQDVKDVFEVVIGRGTVERVDIVVNRQNDGQPFCRIFVHFRYWPNTPEIMSIRQRLLDGEMIKVVYDNPWFWKCSASRVAKPTRPKVTPFIAWSSPVPEEVCGEVAPQGDADAPTCMRLTDANDVDKKDDEKKDDESQDDESEDDEKDDEKDDDGTCQLPETPEVLALLGKLDHAISMGTHEGSS